MENGFYRSGDPKESLRIGLNSKIKEALASHDCSISTLQADVTGIGYSETDGCFNVKLKGIAAYRSLSVVQDWLMRKYGIGDVKINLISEVGAITILDRLDSPALFSRICEYYRDIINRCVKAAFKGCGEIVFENNQSEGLKRASLQPDKLKNSRVYIEGLPKNPPRAEMIELADSVISDILEYAYHGADSNGVTMGAYAHQLSEHLKKT